MVLHLEFETHKQFPGGAKRNSKHRLLSQLKNLLEAFAFRGRGFRSDNGSEYVKHWAGELRAKLRVSSATGGPKQQRLRGHSNRRR